MPGYNAQSIPFDDLFDPDIIGDGPSAPGYSVAGSPLKYAAKSYGSKRADVGYAINSVDVSNLWAGKGTASYNDAVVVMWGIYSSISNNSNNAGASWSLTFNPDGSYGITMTALQGGSISGMPRSGSWHKSPSMGVGDDYEIRITAHVSILNGYHDVDGTNIPTPSYSPSTGWLPMSYPQTIVMDTSNLLGGSSSTRGGNINIFGDYTIEIRRVGGTTIISQSVTASVEAIV